MDEMELTMADILYQNDSFRVRGLKNRLAIELMHVLGPEVKVIEIPLGMVSKLIAAIEDEREQTWPGWRNPGGSERD